MASRLVSSDALQPEKRHQLLAAAAKLQPGLVRDLFEGYLPTEPGERKLGSNPRPRGILALTGDAGRGEKLFWSQAVNCGSCHKIGDRGTAIGPELTHIGKERVREDLLQSILEPSRRIEPKYSAYSAQLADGRLVTGLLIQRDTEWIALRDAQNKELRFRAAEVEQLRPSRLSLMPDGQLSGLTPQAAADLLEYLATRK
jgi:putative heme-binding domain-containing protein